MAKQQDHILIIHYLYKKQPWPLAVIGDKGKIRDVVDELDFPINANMASLPCGTKILDLIGDFI